MKFVLIKNQLIIDKDNVLNVEVKPIQCNNTPTRILKGSFEELTKTTFNVVFIYKNGSTSSHELEGTNQEELATSIKNSLNV